MIFKVGTSKYDYETIHNGQFESGEIALNSETGQPVAMDLDDEVASYKAQFAYDPSSVSGLTSVTVANSFQEITTTWVQNLTSRDGSQPYNIGGTAGTGLFRININSTRDDLIKSYPNTFNTLINLPSTFTKKTDPNAIYKH